MLAELGPGEEKWGQVRRSGEKWRAVGRSGEKWRGAGTSGESAEKCGEWGGKWSGVRKGRVTWGHVGLCDGVKRRAA